MPQLTLSTVSQNKQKLIRMMHSLHFGRIEFLTIHAGEPVFSSTTRVIREIKIGAQRSLDSSGCGNDYILKTQVIELLDHLKQIQNGVIHSIEIRDGLPFRIILEEDVA